MYRSGPSRGWPSVGRWWDGRRGIRWHGDGNGSPPCPLRQSRRLAAPMPIDFHPAERTAWLSRVVRAPEGIRRGSCSRSATPSGVKHLSRRTEEAYAGWIRRFILFHGKRHPDQMGEPEVTEFLTGAGHQGPGQRLDPEPGPGALLFLYRVVLGRQLGGLTASCTPSGRARLPIVMTRDEVRTSLGSSRDVPG